MTEPIRVRASFRKACSDGNYGTEAAEITLEADIDQERPAEHVAEGLLEEARGIVFDQLSKSPSMVVRRSLEPIPAKRPVTVPADELEDLPF